jgi:hypothetical protein
MIIKINSRKLREWEGKMKRRQARVKPAAASTLNYVGEKAADALTRQIAAQTGLPEETIRNKLIIKPASEERLSYEIRTSVGLAEGLDTRPLPFDARRKFVEEKQDTFFKQGELVNILNMGDDRVCDICDAAAEHGPYTVEEARRMIPLHPNCRCVVEPTEKRRVASPAFRQSEDFRVSKSSETVPEVMGELLTRMRSELRQALARP